MENVICDIKTKSTEEIYNLLKDYLEDYYYSILYLRIKKEEFNKIVLEEIEKSKESYDEKESYPVYISRLLKERIKELTITLLKSKREKAYSIIRNYMKPQKKIESDKDIQKEFERLCDFFKEHKYIPRIGFMKRLIQNEDWMKVIAKYIYENNKELLKKTEKSNEIEFIIKKLIVKAYYELEYENNIKDSYDESAYKTYINLIGRISLLPDEDLKPYIIAAQAGDQSARNVVLENNLRLVIDIAKKYINRGVPIMDLIQEGNLGVLEAIKQFDTEYGTVFTTYATYYIKKYIRESIPSQGRNVKISRGDFDTSIKIQTKYPSLIVKYGREPTVKDLAIELDKSEECIIRVLTWMNDTKSLYLQVGDDGSELESFLPQKDTSTNNIYSVELDVEERLFIEAVHELLGNQILNENQRDVIIKHFGLKGYKAQTLEEIAREKNTKRQAQGYKVANAINKLIELPEIIELAQYTDNPEKAIAKVKERRQAIRKDPNVRRKMMPED